MALSAELPSPSLAQRLGIWATMAFVAATIPLFVMQRVFPDVKARLLAAMALPAETPNAVVMLVLVTAGVVMQAGWWMSRRRGAVSGEPEGRAG